MTTKILALTDALGNLARFVLLPGHRIDTVGVAPLIDGLTFGGFIADKAFDSNSIIADLNERGAKILISQHPRRASPLPIDAELYKWRHVIENFFCKLKEFKRIAMRADNTDQSFAAAPTGKTVDVVTVLHREQLWPGATPEAFRSIPTSLLQFDGQPHLGRVHTTQIVGAAWMEWGLDQELGRSVLLE